MFYIFEIQHRTDGQNNLITNSRTTLAGALSFYYERKSKMIVNTEFPTVSVMLTNADLEVIEQETITTQYSEE